MFEYLEKLNPAQREAATTTKGALRIIAGAGSGKTSTLIARVAYLIDSGVPPEEILLLTFTNAAAKEMTLVSLVAKASPAAMPKRSAHVPGFHLPPGSR